MGWRGVQHFVTFLLAPVHPFPQDGLQVAPEAALGAIVAAGRQLGDLEGAIGLSVTAPLVGQKFAADAVHRVVASG